MTGMTATDLAIARDALGLSQGALAAKLGVSRKTVNLWENGTNSLPSDIAARLEAIATDADPIAGEIETSLDPNPDIKPTPFDPDVAGLKPWGPKPDNIQERDFIKNPVGKGWQRCSWRVIHGAIPSPIPYYAPDWAGADNIVSADGRCWNYITGQEIKRLAFTNPANVPKAYGSRQINKTYKGR